MSKIAVLLLADTDTGDALGRMANALTVVKEGKEEGDDVRLVLDGAGTKWAPELAKEDHKYHRLFEDVRDDAGACVYAPTTSGTGSKRPASSSSTSTRATPASVG
jgi:hypothetical protein